MQRSHDAPTPPSPKPLGVTFHRWLWWGLTAGIALLGLRVWDLLLFQRDGETGVLAGWILACWILGIAAASVERRAGSDRREDVPSFWSGRDVTLWVLLLVFSALLLLFDAGFVRAASDGRGYFAQTRSLVIGLDLDFADDVAAFGARESDALFPVGTALLWSPFFLAAHLWLGLLNLLGADHLREGFSNPYQRAVGVGTLVYGFAALLMIAGAVRRRYDRPVAITATLAVLLATPVVWYLTADASMSHGVSLFCVTLFLVLWLSGRGGRRPRDWALLALATVLMVLVRPQNLLYLGVLVADVPDILADVRRRGWIPRSSPLTWTALAAVALLLVALGITFSGPYVEYVQRNRLFSEWSVGQQLFSARHGLVSSSPVLLFALLGIPLLGRRDRGLAVAFGLVILAQVLVGGTTAGWNAGASFGARRFVSCALPFALGLAAAIELARRRPLVPVALLLGGLVLLNLALVDDARRGDLTLSEAVPFERMTEAVGSRLGNPFALLGALHFAWKHDVPIAFYDHLPARMHQRLRVDVGALDDDLYLFGAWYGRETGGSGSFRWASTPEVGLLAWVRAPSYRVAFEAAPFHDPGAPVQRVEVRVGDTPIGVLEMPPGRRRYTVDPPPDLDVGHWWRVSFRFERATAPSDVTDSNDDRPLAARFYEIELVPR